MAAVVNVLHFKEPIDPALFTRAIDEVGDAMRAVEGFEAFEIVQTGETEAVLLIFADTPATLDRIATEIGSPWMVANVVPLLSGPPQRHIGDVIASTR